MRELPDTLPLEDTSAEAKVSKDHRRSNSVQTLPDGLGRLPGRAGQCPKCGGSSAPGEHWLICLACQHAGRWPTECMVCHNPLPPQVRCVAHPACRVNVLDTAA